jgi:hypothetical protein
MLKRYHAGKFFKNQKELEHVCAKDRIGLPPITTLNGSKPGLKVGNEPEFPV